MKNVRERLAHVPYREPFSDRYWHNFGSVFDRFKSCCSLAYAKKAGFSTHSVAGSLCRTQDSEARLPNRDELSSIFYNKLLLDIPATVYWSSSFVDENGAWVQDTGSGYQMPQGRKNDSRHVWCVRR